MKNPNDLNHELIVAGFGGQGVLSLGMVLAYAGMIESREVTWMPSYGPEMRGGTANCITILSSRPVSSPIISTFDSALILNQPSFDKFAATVKPGGSIFYDSQSVQNTAAQSQGTRYSIPAAGAAAELGSPRIMNMVMLGAFLHTHPVVSEDSVIAALKKVLPAHRHNLLDLNRQALGKGAELARTAHSTEV